jgi:hypothetical protein
VAFPLLLLVVGLVVLTLVAVFLEALVAGVELWVAVEVLAVQVQPIKAMQVAHLQAKTKAVEVAALDKLDRLVVLEPMVVMEFPHPSMEVQSLVAVVAVAQNALVLAVMSGLAVVVVVVLVMVVLALQQHQEQSILAVVAVVVLATQALALVAQAVLEL